MTTRQQVLKDMKEILQAVPQIEFVHIGKPRSLPEEDTFPAAYILPASEVFQVDRQGLSLAGYDTSYLVRVILNISNELDDLYFGEVIDAAIRGVLDDTLVWNQIINRDIVSVTYDEFGQEPKSSAELLFEFRYREPCSV